METLSELFGQGKPAETKDWTWAEGLVDNEGSVGVFFLCEGLFDWLRERGFVYRGVSFSYRLPLSVLTVKAFKDGQGFVTFISGESLVKCATYLARKCLADAVEWREDKFT